MSPSWTSVWTQIDDTTGVANDWGTDTRLVGVEGGVKEMIFYSDYYGKKDLTILLTYIYFVSCISVFFLFHSRDMNE